MVSPSVFTIKDIVNIAKERRENKFDFNIAVTGARGNGKSTCIGKIFFRLDGFDPWKHIIYNREDAIKLLSEQKYGLCWDDEAINSGYKREFQNKGQQEMIKFITAYRDNFNIFASAIPNFFSLDKDLRDLFFMHIFVKSRGIAHVHMPIQGRVYSVDKWDAANNAKIEAKWTQRMRSDHDFKPPYHKLTTFRGYLFFGDLTKNQKKIYEKVKFEKRKVSFENFDEPKQVKFIDKMYNAVISGEIDQEFLLKACLIEGEKFSSIQRRLNMMLKDNGKGTLLQEIGKTPTKLSKEESMENNKVLSVIPEV